MYGTIERIDILKAVGDPLDRPIHGKIQAFNLILSRFLMTEPYSIFSGTSHPDFSIELATYLGTSMGHVSFKPFPDGEIYVQIEDNVRGRDVFVIQSVAREPNYYLMELLIMIDALKRASAKSIVAVIPYFGYARQDRKDKPRVPITAKLIADLLAAAGATRVLTMDLHAGQIQGFFDVPVDNLYARPMLADAMLKEKKNDLIVMAPDLGAIKIARAYANHLKADFGVIDKRRVSSEEVAVTALIGNVKGRDVLLADDMCSTGGTLIQAAHACKEAGAKRIFVAFSHGLLVGDAKTQLINSPIEKIFMSNTVPPLEEHTHEKIEIVSVAGLFGEAIRCIISAESISSIFY
ncbi:MAG: ribose-phosphate pyrophosphokinase [Chlamydiales bacterium]|nr:ribose-phosphate pyrophosphokinase [Chlamydiales bacterium]